VKSQLGELRPQPLGKHVGIPPNDQHLDRHWEKPSGKLCGMRGSRGTLVTSLQRCKRR
jgi:hypothetical protein